MTLSHNGATLVTCDSFDNQISVINTATWSRVAVVPLGTGNFPVRAVFSPDDSKIYVSDRDSDHISVINNAGASSAGGGPHRARCIPPHNAAATPRLHQHL